MNVEQTRLSKPVKLAEWISDYLNPLVICLFMILVLAFRSTSNWIDALKWFSLLCLLCPLPIYFYAFLQVKKGRLSSIFSNAREQRKRIYVAAFLANLAALAIMALLGAPLRLLAGVAAGLLILSFFALVNLVWKISIHTAFASALSALVIASFGSGYLVIVVLPLVMGWSRVQLAEHTLGQVISGGMIAFMVIFVVFKNFGAV